MGRPPGPAAGRRAPRSRGRPADHRFAGVTGDGGVAEMGQQLVDRLLPDAVPRFAELARRMAEADPAGPADAADADMLTSLSLLWPGYFAQPETAPAMPP